MSTQMVSTDPGTAGTVPEVQKPILAETKKQKPNSKRGMR
jgi:hypothetical protein